MAEGERSRQGAVEAPILTLMYCILGEFTFWLKFEFYKVQLTYGANHLSIHGKEK